MSDPYEPTIHESSVMTVIEDLEKDLRNFDPMQIGPIAVRTQLAHAILVGYQAIEMQRLTNYLQGAESSLARIANILEEGNDKSIVDAIEAVRKQLSANG